MTVKSKPEEKYRWEADRGEPARPYRLWNAATERNLRWRSYAILRNALNGAFLEAKWLRPGDIVEVYDVRTWKVYATYERREASVAIRQEKSS